MGVQLSAFRERLRTYHKVSFQQYIDALDARRDIDPALKKPGDAIVDGVGYALLSLVDPATLSFHCMGSAADYATRAREHGLVVAAALATGEAESDDLEQLSARRGPASMGAALMYDWTVGRGVWSTRDKQTLADGFIAAHDARMKAPWRARFVMSEGNPSRAQQGQFGALAMWGEAIPGQAKTGQPFDVEMQRLLDQLNADWNGYLLPTLDFLLGGRSGWAEGSSYNQESFTSVVMLVGALSTSLDVNYVAQHGFLHYWPLWVLGLMRPTPQPDGRPGMAKMDTSGVRDTADFSNYGRTLHATAAMLQGTDDQLAGLSRWMIEHWKLGPPQADTSVRSYWWLWRFIWGYEHVRPVTPEEAKVPLALRHGQGVYTWRSGYGSSSDTLIVVNANENASNVGGHAAVDNSSFMIEKFGNLVLQGGNRKGGPGRPHASSQLDFSLMGVYKPGEETLEGQARGNYMGMKYQRSAGEANPACAVERCGVGRIVAETLNGDGFDYLSLDYSRSWDPLKVKSAMRDFIYLRPERPNAGEYVLVLDRVIAGDPAFQKRWHIKVPFDAEAVEGGTWTGVEVGRSAATPANAASADAGPGPTATAPRGRQGRERARNGEAKAGRAKSGAAKNGPQRGRERRSKPSQAAVAPREADGGVWEAPGATTLRMVNRYDSAHGVLFLKSIFPVSTTLRKIGGDGYEFRDADLHNYNEKGPQQLSDDSADVMGRYRIEIVPRTPRTDDLFVTAMQIGDADRLVKMTPVRPLQTESDTLAGVEILDPAARRVVVFSTDPHGRPLAGPIRYRITGGPAQTSHLVLNLKPATAYFFSEAASNGQTAITIAETPLPGASGMRVLSDKSGALNIVSGRKDH